MYRPLTRALVAVVLIGIALIHTSCGPRMRSSHTVAGGSESRSGIKTVALAGYSVTIGEETSSGGAVDIQYEGMVSGFSEADLFVLMDADELLIHPAYHNLSYTLAESRRGLNLRAPDGLKGIGPKDRSDFGLLAINLGVEAVMLVSTEVVHPLQMTGPFGRMELGLKIESVVYDRSGTVLLETDGVQIASGYYTISWLGSFFSGGQAGAAANGQMFDDLSSKALREFATGRFADAWKVKVIDLSYIP